MIYENRKQKQINDFKRNCCNTLNNSTKNSIKLWHGTGKEERLINHEAQKVQVCFELWKKGIDFYTEFQLRGGKLRPDIVCFPSTKTILFIEVRESEEEKTSEEKQRTFIREFANGMNVKWFFIDSQEDFDVHKIL